MVNVVKTSVSLPRDKYDYVKEMADKYYGGNVSVCLSYIITKFKEQEEKKEVSK
jgi:hypothetical protein